MSLLNRLIRRAGFGAAVLAFAAILPAPAAAQKGQPPINVTVQLTGNAVTIAWGPTRTRGVTYRVLRDLDAKAPGVDITKPVMDIFTAVDGDQPVPGTTYFYQVVAAYDVDGTTGAAAPVAFTMPGPVDVAPPVVRSRAAAGVTSPPLTLAPAGAASRSPLATPTAVTGITVIGTPASATVTWDQVNGAVNYAVTRTNPTIPGYQLPPKGSSPVLTTTSWIDQGPQALGFSLAGTYRYDVTAMLGNSTRVTGQANWTRPNPTCAAPPASQPMLTVLAPLAAFVQNYGPFPSGAVFDWHSRPGVMAYLAERSVSGINAWTVAATTCGGGSQIQILGPPVGIYGYGLGQALLRFNDPLGVVPNTAYAYRVTAFAANGETGTSTVAWTAPAPFVLHWLSATVAANSGTGNSVTLKWRYEPPATNPPALPYTWNVAAQYGLNQRASSSGCQYLQGCTYVVTNVPAGTHKFTMTAAWPLHLGNGPTNDPIITRATMDTTLTVP